jgi:hypothetical protein
MPVRSFVLALFLLISTTPLGWAAEPAGPTIVLQLQLPPSTSPEAVKGLIADLAAKGALPVTQPTVPPGAATQPTFTAARLAAQVWDGSRQPVQALPALRQAPKIWIEKVVAGGGGLGVAFGFWMVALAGLMAAAPIGTAFRALADRQTRVTERDRRRAGGWPSFGSSLRYPAQKGVVGKLETDAGGGELAGQPAMSVAIELQAERTPSRARR